MSILVRLPANQYQTDAFDGFAANGFSLGTARAAAWLSQLAYEDDGEKIASIARIWQLEPVALIRPPLASVRPLPSTRGFVLKGRGAHFVAFAGTDPLVTANWVTDFDFPLDADGIHEGFAAALEVAWSDIAAALTQHGPVEKLIVTGHSLGAALAALSARRVLAELPIRPQAIYTFGMPRAGGAAFADPFNVALGEGTYRFVHGDDIVARVPPTELGFKHVGRSILCNSGGKFDAAALSAGMSDDPPFVAGLLDGLKDGLLQALGASLAPELRPDLLGQASRLLPPGIADHLPDRYWRALQPR
jgi:hypothetical protein